MKSAHSEEIRPGMLHDWLMSQNCCQLSRLITTGDWYCVNCGDHQFASRLVCRKCSAPRPSEEEEGEGFSFVGGYDAPGAVLVEDIEGGQEEKEDEEGISGDFIRGNTNLHHQGNGHHRGGRRGYRQQQHQHQQQLQQQMQLSQMQNYYPAMSNPNYFDYYQQMLNGMGMRPGDWLCVSCNELNFASRRVCRKCNFNPSLYFAQFPVPNTNSRYHLFPLALYFSSRAWTNAH